MLNTLPTNSEKPLAVFDTDGTIFKSACVEKVINEAITQQVFDREPFQRAHEYRRRWQRNNHEGLYQSYLHHLVGGFVASIAGVEVERFKQVIDQMVSEHEYRLFGYTKRLAEMLRPSHRRISISGSPEMVVKPFLRSLEFDQVIGSQFEVVDGYYTGNATGTNKAEVLARFKHNSIDVGVGDTVGDVPVLAQARCPIAFNPSSALYQDAKQNRWFIVHEHKDFVTQFLPNWEGYTHSFDRNPAVILDAAGIVYG